MILKYTKYILDIVVFLFAGIGVLAVAVVLFVSDFPIDGEETEQKEYDLYVIATALKLYHLDNGVYPTTEQTLKAIISLPTVEPIPTNFPEGGYLGELPIDSWGNDYGYFTVGENAIIFSYGNPKEDGIVSAYYLHSLSK